MTLRSGCGSLPPEAEPAFLKRCRSWMATRLASGTAWKCWLAVDGDQPIGAAWLQLLEKIPRSRGRARAPWIRRQPVDRGAPRETGVGSALLQPWLQECESHGWPERSSSLGTRPVAGRFISDTGSRCATTCWNSRDPRPAECHTDLLRPSPRRDTVSSPAGRVTSVCRSSDNSSNEVMRSGRWSFPAPVPELPAPVERITGDRVARRVISRSRSLRPTHSFTWSGRRVRVQQRPPSFGAWSLPVLPGSGSGRASARAPWPALY